ncbi:exodeoxyribonuclease V subunit alpha [Dokdonella ginsengisoli]|uniref:RecBCD enzyme subunit RecD n=1 Tax=Dokdonella ginsengisoli TaxID=363846 RepID=A0ABV9QXG7_9GAMM
MSAYSFVRLPGESAVEAWRPLDRALYRWVVSHGGDALLAATAAWASLADGNGDAALALPDGRHGMEAPTPAQLVQLCASPLVATAVEQGVRPFALDGGRFYLWRNHAHEVAAARLIRERRSAVSTAPGAVESEADLDALFHGDRSAAVAPQREAVRRVAGRRLFVLTGGPGTGKTTTVLRMLLMLQRQAAAPLTLRIAAPTGKAAQRLVQALRLGKARLRDHPVAPLPEDWRPLLDAIPDGEATTVHRLLGYQPWRNAFRRDARDPIAADVVVVDEASMVDLAMLRSLLEAVRPQATLILVGDADQLTSVATGSVLLDLVAALEADPRGDLVRLTHSFRAERQLAAVNEAVRAGDAGALDAALAASDGRAALRRVEDERALREQVARWARELAAVVALRPALPAQRDGAPDEDALRRRAELVRSALDALADRQLLCALRETPFGALALNALLEANLRRLWSVDAQAEWYPGRAVIVTRNDYAAGLFNGDVGLCLADAAGNLRVWFEGAEGEGDAGLRGFAPHGLPAHESAFAITIHKSQGSEYRHAAVLLPPDAEHRILSRQLLYTGVSRAKQSIEIWTAPAALQAALATEVRRAGGLQERLVAPG